MTFGRGRQLSPLPFVCRLLFGRRDGRSEVMVASIKIRDRLFWRLQGCHLRDAIKRVGGGEPLNRRTWWCFFGGGKWIGPSEPPHF